MAEIVVLSGGVGGARFCLGLVDLVGPQEVTIVGNVGDDTELHGLHISPDLDSLLYTLTDRNDEERGWGRRRETWNAHDTLKELGDDEAWFQFGDRDLGLHLVRTKGLKAGQTLSQVTAHIASGLGLEARLLPATDDRLRTIVETEAGDFGLQEWFVQRGHKEKVDGLRFEGAEFARPCAGRDRGDRPGVARRDRAEQPVHLDLADPRRVGDPRDRQRKLTPVVGVSPVIGGKAVKGPADEMLKRLAGGTSPAHVARCYPGCSTRSSSTRPTPPEPTRSRQRACGRMSPAR